MNRRFTAAFMALVFALTTMIVGIDLAVRADDSLANLNPAGNVGVKDDGSGMVVNKYLSTNSNGNYDLTLEAYSTKEMKPITEKIPTDFVVVVDQSGSMDTQDMPTGEPSVTSGYIEDIASGRYYYYDSSTDNYYRVYGVRDYLYHYYPANYWFVGDIIEYLNTNLGWFMPESEMSDPENFQNMFYFRETVDGKTYYEPITMTVKGRALRYDVRFKYDSKESGTEKWFNREDRTYTNGAQSPWYKNFMGGGLIDSTWGVNIPLYGLFGYPQIDDVVQGIFPNDNEYCYSEFTFIPGILKGRTGMYINYPMYDRKVGYTKLCYRDINGVEHVLQADGDNNTTNWEFCDQNGQALNGQEGSRPVYSNLYEFPGTTDRLSSLKAALNQFAQAVADEEDTFGAVDNKISIVGFSSKYTDTDYTNTELLTGTNLTINNNNGIQMRDASTEDYTTSLVSSTNGNVGEVNGKVSDAINALTANGGTQPEDGLEMAYKVLTNRKTAATKYTIRSGENKGVIVDRNTIVIFFTDGQLGDYHTSNQYSEANDVVNSALAIKQYGTDLFAIGVFGESDGNPLTYTHATASNSSGEDPNWKYLGGWMESYHDPYYPYSWYCLRRQWRSGADGYTNTANDTIFDYMSVTSSNYPAAKNYIDPEWLNGTFSGTYTEATDGDNVRQNRSAEATNKYYRMASNQDTLVAAFMQAVTMTNMDPIETPVDLSETAVLKDILSSNFTVDIPEGETQPEIICETVKCTMDANKEVSECVGDNTREDISNVISHNYNSETKTFTITGFDYSTNYIANPKPADSDHGLAENEGKKLVVTIKNVHPNASVTSSDDVIFSNENTSGMISDNELLIAFPEPSISRHSYTLDVQGENKANAKFDVTAGLTGGTSSLDDVILVKPDGNRVKYSPAQTFEMSDTDSFYFENVPSDYTITTSVEAKDNDFTYTMWANNETANKSELNTETGTNRDLPYSDNTLHIASVANMREVTITETVSGNYANDLDTFQPIVYLVPSSGDVPDEGITLNGTAWTKVPDENKLTTNIAAIQGDGSSTTITVPAGWTLYVEQTDDKEYTVESISYSTGSSESQAYDSTTGIPLTENVAVTINNDRSNITIEGLGNETGSTNVIVYALAGLAVASGGAGVAYL